MKFLLLLLLGPLLELWFLIEVGSVIGGFTTVFLVVFTAVLGLALIRVQGFDTLMRAQQKMAAGEPPATEMLEGMLLAVAGVMLLIPGFISDTFGFLLLVPPLRKVLVKQFVIKRSTPYGSDSGPDSYHQNRSQSGRTLEGEYDRIDD